MTITIFKIENVGLTIRFPDRKDVLLRMTLSWNDPVVTKGNLLISYSVDGNDCNIVFNNKRKELVVTHPSVMRDETISELLTFSISGRLSDPSDLFTLTATAVIENSAPATSITTILIN